MVGKTITAFLTLSGPENAGICPLLDSGRGGQLSFVTSRSRHKKIFGHSSSSSSPTHNPSITHRSIFPSHTALTRLPNPYTSAINRPYILLVIHYITKRMLSAQITPPNHNLPQAHHTNIPTTIVTHDQTSTICLMSPDGSILSHFAKSSEECICFAWELKFAYLYHRQ